ncbi:MAG: hypothetical protein P1P80_06775 [ANME-2 cluster archaeon]|nr:hypothetical protein [ANME-2 cluster archaeon]
MPFTIFHLGPGSWIGLVAFRVFHYPTLLIASVIIDLEPFFVLYGNLDQPLHGILHSFLGGAVIALITSIGIYYGRNELNKIMTFFRLAQDSSYKQIMFTSLFGVYLHILLDSPLYLDIKPFYPFELNPFYDLFSFQQVLLFCIVSFVITIGYYSFNFLMSKEKTN